MTGQCPENSALHGRGVCRQLSSRTVRARPVARPVAGSIGGITVGGCLLLWICGRVSKESLLTIPILIRAVSMQGRQPAAELWSSGVFRNRDLPGWQAP